MSASDSQLKHWYDKYNFKWFDGKLPTDTLIYWEPPPAAYAETCPVFENDHSHFIVKLDPSIRALKQWWKIVLLHEMIHIKLRPKHPKSQHGRLFQEEMKRLAYDGAFRNLW